MARTIASSMGSTPVSPEAEMLPRSQPFKVPLPRTGQGLVEIVDAEHQGASRVTTS
jgi:hypothetical protein